MLGSRAAVREVEDVVRVLTVKMDRGVAVVVEAVVSCVFSAHAWGMERGAAVEATKNVEKRSAGAGQCGLGVPWHSKVGCCACCGPVVSTQEGLGTGC